MLDVGGRGVEEAGRFGDCGHPRLDSLSGEEQHDGAELRAVLASSGVAGVHGTVRRPEAGEKWRRQRS